MPSSQRLPPVRPVPTDPAPRGLDGGVPSAVEESVLDSAALARLAELDPRGESQLLNRVLATFQSSALRLCAQLRTAQAAGDRKAVRLVAHTLKSSSGYIGALQLAHCCATLEAATHVASHVDLAPEIDAMTAALEGVLAAVARRLGAR